MKKNLNVFFIGLLVLMFVAACAGSGSPEPAPAGTVSPAWCVTATPASGTGSAGVSVIATPAGRTTPSSGSPGDEATVSPSDLATREAQLQQHNQPQPLPTGAEAGATSLPVCPTITPAP